MKEERFPHPGHPLHQLSDEPGQGASETQRCVQQLACSRQKRDQHTWSWPPCCILQPKIRISWSVWGLVLKTWASADRPGERTEAGCMDSPKRLECCSGCNERVQDRVQVVTEAPLLMCTPRERWSPAIAAAFCKELRVGMALPL